MNEHEDDYPCIGVCAPDPETGLCIGCGRPLHADQDSSTEIPSSSVVLDAGQAAKSAESSSS
jgi:hypothetical protein